MGTRHGTQIGVGWCGGGRTGKTRADETRGGQREGGGKGGVWRRKGGLWRRLARHKSGGRRTVLAAAKGVRTILRIRRDHGEEPLF